MKRLFAAALLLGTSSAALAAQDEARRIHERLLTLDTHLDTPMSLDLPGWHIEQAHRVGGDYSQVDLPRMKQGGLDGGFWAIYTPQGPLDAEGYRRARDFAIMRGVSIREMAAAHPKEIALATRADEAAPIVASGRRVAFMSIENAYPLGEDVSLLSTFQKMGVRMLGFAHFANNQFADSATDPKGPRWHGLSPLGRQLLSEANRLGIILDASHSSDDVFDQMLALSTAPIILSHSGCKAVFDHPRNISDDRLRALAAKGGLIQINAYPTYLKAAKPNPEREKALKALYATRGEARLSEAGYAAFLERRREIDRLYPEVDRPTFDDVMNHLLHALKVVGPDHVGIGLDWDGGGGVEGMEDVSAIPRITQALLKAGYSEADLAKIWSGNVLNLLRQVEAKAAK